MEDSVLVILYDFKKMFIIAIWAILTRLFYVSSTECDCGFTSNIFGCYNHNIWNCYTNSFLKISLGYNLSRNIKFFNVSSTKCDCGHTSAIFSRNYHNILNC
jgi:hypothetical protein